MKLYGIKQEERTNPAPVSIPRPLPYSTNYKYLLLV